MTQPPEPPLTDNLPGSPSHDERTWGMIVHLAGIAALLGGFGGLIATLVVWLIKKDTMPFVDRQGKEALNFQITVMIAVLVCVPCMFVLIGVPMIVAILICDVVFSIIGGLKANEGVAYRYPVALRLIK